MSVERWGIPRDLKCQIKRPCHWIQGEKKNVNNDSQILGFIICTEDGAIQWGKKWEFNLVTGCGTLM